MLNGLDPEFLIIDNDGYIVPSELVIPTDFKEYLDNKSSQHGHQTVSPERLSPDNAAVEIRPSAGGCLQTLSGRTKALMAAAEKFHRYGRMRGSIPESDMSITPAAQLRPEHRDLETVSVFGCAPSLLLTDDFDIVEQSPQAEASELEHRSAGFHVHHSRYDLKAGNKDRAIIKLMPIIATLDAVMGLVDVMMNDAAGLLEASRIRRELLGYGLGGEFRIVDRSKGHFEYRTLSPWPLSHPIWTWWASSMVRGVCDHTSDEIMGSLPDRSEILDVITSGTAKDAMPLWLASVKTLHRLSEGNSNSGNNALHYNNLARLYQALTNGGHSYYTLNLPPYKAWRLGHATPKMRAQAGVSSKIQNRRRYTERGAAVPAFLNPLKYNRTRYSGPVCYFPSGTAYLLDEEYGIEPHSLRLPRTD